MAKYIIGMQSKYKIKIIRYSAAIGIYLFFMSILQTSLLSPIRIFGGVPDIMIATVVCISVCCGYYAGAITGIAAGFMTDALGTVGLSLLPLVYFLVGYLVGYVAKIMNTKGITAYLIGIGIALPIRLITTLIQTIYYAEAFHLPTFLIRVALPELAATALLSLIVFFPTFALSRWLIKRD